MQVNSTAAVAAETLKKANVYTREAPKAVYELENYGAETERCVYCLFQRRIVD